MKKSLIVLVAIAISMSLLFTNWSWRWVALHGWSATKQAKILLSGGDETDDEFIDYLVYSMGSCVVFSEHETEGRAMVYCSKGIPAQTNKIGALTHLVGNWYTTQ
ncbi:hypothetical protein A7981_01930 [Methylovorus sp. MM2]|uniref:hypothetical protein n=1 Tax=Methylovorus sp. MM2 TaxID=1848038 RepID=UPI0007E1121A|nr:hypothetical protein [Methylovorus sp. MM2]OAM52272.1 hypothetical protein A7981_01930 [Methylovorus sp. MM2]